MERIKPISISKLPVLGPEFYYQPGDDPIGRRDIYFKERSRVNAEIFSIVRSFPSDEKIRERITWSLCNNTPYASRELRISRGVSAYFSYDPNAQAVVVEWGKINYLDSRSKVHTFLNGKCACFQTEMKICSGHLARAGMKGKVFDIALIDSQRGSGLVCPEERDYLVIAGLTLGGIIPLSADGYCKITQEIA
jgi:hypothetical protein